MPTYQKVIAAMICLGFIWYMWPTAKKWMKEGPKGSSSQWQSFFLIILVIGGFVALLVYMLKK